MRPKPLRQLKNKLTLHNQSEDKIVVWVGGRMDSNYTDGVTTRFGAPTKFGEFLQLWNYELFGPISKPSNHGAGICGGIPPNG